jgi:hypothetical protein
MKDFQGVLQELGGSVGMQYFVSWIPERLIGVAKQAE